MWFADASVLTGQGYRRGGLLQLAPLATDGDYRLLKFAVPGRTKIL
jgi:hypothetical protein